jgi:hypothetical protein
MAEEIPDTSYERDENFISLYANNVRFEISAWDLKMIFGQLDQSKSPQVVEQHTAITMPWSTALITAYLLVVNLIIHQTSEGHAIHIPERVIPAKPDLSAPEMTDADKTTAEYIVWVHEQFFGRNALMPTASAPLTPPE